VRFAPGRQPTSAKDVWLFDIVVLSVKQHIGKPYIDSIAATKGRRCKMAMYIQVQQVVEPYVKGPVVTSPKLK
jgi:hypothetical protein